MTEKEEARSRVRARLRAMTGAERDAAGAHIAQRVWELPEVSSARSLLLYAHLLGEVPTDAIADEAARRGLVVAYPRCLPDTREMALHRVGASRELRSGSYGIREPDASCPILTPGDIDAALIPGLAWDRRGGRLGRGAGYYDRLFAHPDWRAFRCGLFFARQELDAVPTDPWDVRLDAVVTEASVLRTGGL